jgi:hypothetical protein
VTFMPEHEIRAHVDECLEDACLAAIQGQSDAKIAAALLSHREQRFRLFYPLGAWPDERANKPGDDFAFDNDEPESDEIDEQETVSNAEARAQRGAPS